MADATAKLPATLPALTDFGGEFVGDAEAEWTAASAHTSGAAVPFSLIVTEAISARVPTVGWLKTHNGESLHYNAVNTGTKTFTVDARAQQDTTAAAIDIGQWIGFGLTKRTMNQILAELIEIAKMARVEAQSIGAAALTLNWALGSTKVVTRTGTPTGLTLSNPVNGITYRIILLPAAFDWPAWPAAVSWGSSAAPTLTQNKGHIIDLIWNSTDSEYYGVYVTGFS